MKRLVAVSIAAMMLFSSCGKSHSLLEPKQTEVVKNPGETERELVIPYRVLIGEEGLSYRDLGAVAFVYLGIPTFFAFLNYIGFNSPTSNTTKNPKT
jgi:hypothetical protein